MIEAWVGFASALWLGIMTSISPCPLASNVAAISFLSKKIAHPRLVFLSGLAYTLGRMLSYAILGWLIISSLLSVPQTAQFLQKYMSRALGPLLIVLGLMLLEVITIKWPGIALSEKHHNKLSNSGAPGAFALGFIFALAFCPVSAALFFGSLIPLSLNHRFGTSLPFIYGVGTGLPVMIFAVAIAFGVKSFSRWFQWLTRLELYMRKIAGVTFLIVGVYYSINYFM